MEEGVSAVNKQVESKEEVVAEEEDEEEKAVKKAEMMENWYSSSEDDDDDGDQPLTAVLKKLQQEVSAVVRCLILFKVNGDNAYRVMFSRYRSRQYNLHFNVLCST